VFEVRANTSTEHEMCQFKSISPINISLIHMQTFVAPSQLQSRDPFPCLHYRRYCMSIRPIVVLKCWYLLYLHLPLPVHSPACSRSASRYKHLIDTERDPIVALPSYQFNHLAVERSCKTGRNSFGGWQVA
jgi:hypothetical protein